MGEFRVHHIRFFEWNPQAIQCMAYNKARNRLALSRSSGSIELWSLKDGWYQEEIIPGSDGQSIEDLVWQQDRLFTAGLDGYINEIDLVTLRIKTSCPSNAGPVWSLASNPAGTKLAAGTEEGYVVLLDTEHGMLEYSGRCDSQESRILCLCWHPTDDLIVTGGIDNIRLWSMSSGRAIQRMSLARQDKNKETVVWCVAFLSDMTIVSGDSRGKTCFWNGKHGTVIKSLQGHKADVYCLAVHPSENIVVSSGVDSSVVQFNYISGSETSDWKDWVTTFIHNHHTHDVRAVQIIDNTVVTGGVDTALIVFDLPHIAGHRSKYTPKNKWKRITAIPQRSLVKVAQDANLVLLQYPHSLEVWRLGFTDRTGSNGDILPLRSNPIKLIQLKTKAGSAVYCCDISHDGTMLAYSDCETTRVYRITMDDVQGIQPDVSMSRVTASTDCPPDGAHCMCFLSTSNRLVTVNASSRLQISGIAADGKLAVEHTFPSLSESYHLLCVSKDDRYAAAADHCCNVHIYDLQDRQHVCSVPQASSQVSTMAFSPDSSALVMAYTDQKIVEFDVLAGEYTDWCKTHIQRFADCWLRRRTKIVKIMYNPSNPHQLIFHDEQMLCILDKTQAFPARDVLWAQLSTHRPDAPAAFHLCNKYKFLLNVTAMADNWLVTVERPQLDIQNSLPDALKKKKFGT